MLGIIIGSLLMVFGFVFGSTVLVILGLMAAVAFTFLNKPAETKYIEVERPVGKRTKHIIIAPEPPEEPSLDPYGMFGNVAKVVEKVYNDKEIEGLKKKLEKEGKSKEEIKKEVKGLKEKIRTGEKIMISDVLPFKNYGYGTPSERLFTNFPAYIRKKIFAKAVPPSKEED